MHESRKTWKALITGTLAVFGLLLAPVSQALAQSIFVESGGQVVVEAEHFSSRTATIPDNWLIVPTEAAGFPTQFANHRGDGYLQNLPDVLLNSTGIGGGVGNPPFVEYTLQITTTGTYRLYVRWDSHDNNSDSFYVNIVEFFDGIGGIIPDWYRYASGPDDRNFATRPWHGIAGFERTDAIGFEIPTEWAISEPGDYTLRFAEREDGAAIDAFILQISSLPAPTANGPPESEIVAPTSVPSASAGPDQTVDEGLLVILDGSGSSDPQGDSLNYNWTQIAGPTVTPTGADTATPSFDAPDVSVNQTLTFELIVDDGSNFSEPDSVDIVVVSVIASDPPVADAGIDSTIKPGAIATLDGSGSFDPQSDPITYQWTQVAGTVVTLSNDAAQQPTFTAPNAVGDVLLFKLQVADEFDSSTPSAGTDSSLADTVAVTIVPNSQPVANAGPGQTKDEGSVVTLNGAASFDSDGGDILSFQWTQTGGTPVTLSNSTVSVPTLAAPFVGVGGDDLIFSLVVTDDDPVNPLASLSDDVTIHVSNINDPPSCNLAVANPGTLWPPTHKMKSVNIEGVMDSDAEFNTVTLQITAVTQDEPVNGLGDGDSSPDAVVQIGVPADSLLVRAERSGNENGRVYSIAFTASDGFESCSGTVEVTVPHSRKSVPVDDGQTYDSTQP